MLRKPGISNLISAACVCLVGCGAAGGEDDSTSEAAGSTGGTTTVTTDGSSGGTTGVNPVVTTGGTAPVGTTGGASTGGASTGGAATGGSAAGGSPTGGSTSTGGSIHSGGETEPTCAGATDDPILVPNYDSDDGGERNDSYVDMVKDATEFSLSEAQNLESYPEGKTSVYLHAAGYFSFLSEPKHVAQVVRLWRHVAESLRPFDVNVTTSQAAMNKVGQANSLFVSFSIHTGAGGSCPRPHFGYGQTQGGHTCQSSVEFYAVIHEIGHGLGVNHHTSPYENIIGEGIKYINVHTSRSDNGAYFAHWVSGDTQNTDGANIFYQDDLKVISDVLGWRPDDHGGAMNDATPLVVSGGAARPQTNNGIIAEDGEMDTFSFTTTGGDIDLDVRPQRFYNSLHAAADVIDSDGNVVIPGVPMFHYDYDTWPSDAWPGVGDGDERNINVRHGVKLRGCLEAGTHYVRVSNSGFLDASGDGYTSYSSLGYYDLKGAVPE
jgi:hypothetical protein